MGKSNIMNLNNNTASERMGKPVRFFYQKWRKITWKKQM